ncbi:calcium-binding protein [Allochromatium vinosum]|uniref:Peptidase M10 serralysin n=1 Tax=Allochromatium vinosum (strain ATCC 17899 / DSM 180 / NBRC 103801 / NCIMB 10441 / D) TaxID=572477 RepID=D3RMH3_ALLVD|nr:calcium-binding protein [Allochromatium vinosum]ADC61231.1 Peptidase M10 serralysin [Allochromatium vinosum DSM 180]
MATYYFSKITNGQTLTFTPGSDILQFDDDTISAGLGSVTQVQTDLLFSYGGKTFTLKNVVLGQLTMSNVKFKNGSLLLVGDNTTDIAKDELNNPLTGAAQSDFLHGLGGNDTLDGKAGADIMIGGDGADTYIVDNDSDQVNETNASTGLDQWDTVKSSVSYTLGANVEQLNLTGATAINGTGNTLKNVLIGNSAANRLDGGKGDDRMEGGNGNDTYVVDSTKDEVIETSALAAGGVDTVESWISYTLTANVENLLLLGTANNSATGNTLNNRLTGNSGSNRLDGVTGADTMEGGDGQDVYVVNSADDVVIETNTSTSSLQIDLVEASLSYTLTANVEWLQLMGTTSINATGNTGDNLLIANVGNNVFDGVSGNDTVSYSLSSPYIASINPKSSINQSANPALAGVKVSLAVTGAQATIGSGMDKLNNIDNLIGSRFNDQLTGNSSANILDGGLGADVLIGGDGNDIYYVDGNDTVIETNASKTQSDTVRSIVSYVLGANLEKLELIGSDNIHGTGNELQNTIIGNDKDNLLDGAGGADRLEGGKGNDTYLVDGFDTVIEAGSAGTDTIMTEVGILNNTLPTNVENLLLLGSVNLTGKGNTLANVIYANVGDNLLDGVKNTSSSSKDTLSYEFGATAGVRVNLSLLGSAQNTGGSGTDTLVGDSFHNLTGSYYNDILQGTTSDNVLNGLGGSDTVSYENSATGSVIINLNLSTRQNTLGSGGDTLLSIENITGSTFDDTIIASSGNNIMDGGLGSDTVSYVKSDGLVAVNLAVTTAQNTGGSGKDTLIKIENLIGSNYNDSLTGNTGANRLDGGKGADALKGGAGDDVYVVDNAGDVVTEAFSQGNDTVQSWINLTLGGNIENLELMYDKSLGDANNPKTGTGNTLNNTLTGNALSNTLSGLGGNDVLDGAGGQDSLTGGGGADRFVFSVVTDTSASMPDVITDFTRSQSDKIDLSLATFYEGVFKFVGIKAFSGVSGELRYQTLSNKTLITGDTNGDKVADFAIELTGAIAMQASDFVL